MSKACTVTPKCETEAEIVSHQAKIHFEFYKSLKVKENPFNWLLGGDEFERKESGNWFHSIISQLDDLFLMIAGEAGFKEL